MHCWPNLMVPLCKERYLADRGRNSIFQCPASPETQILLLVHSYSSHVTSVIRKHYWSELQFALKIELIMLGSGINSPILNISLVSCISKHFLPSWRSILVRNTSLELAKIHEILNSSCRFSYHCLVSTSKQKHSYSFVWGQDQQVNKETGKPMAQERGSLGPQMAMVQLLVLFSGSLSGLSFPRKKQYHMKNTAPISRNRDCILFLRIRLLNWRVAGFYFFFLEKIRNKVFSLLYQLKTLLFSLV